MLLHHAIVHKFVQNADLREKLLETGDAILAHTYDRDNIFATGCDREKMLEWAKNNNGQIIKVCRSVVNSFSCPCDFVHLRPLGVNVK